MSSLTSIQVLLLVILINCVYCRPGGYSYTRADGTGGVAYAENTSGYLQSPNGPYTYSRVDANGKTVIAERRGGGDSMLSNNQFTFERPEPGKLTLASNGDGYNHDFVRNTESGVATFSRIDNKQTEAFARSDHSGGTLRLGAGDTNLFDRIL